MKYAFLAVSAFIAILTQTVAGNSYFIFSYLDLSLVLVAFWAVYRNRTQALFVGSIIGILQDAMLGWPLGYNGFGKTLAAFMVGQAAKHFNIEGAWIRFLLIASAGFISALSVFGLFLLMQRNVDILFLGGSLMQAVITGAAGTLVFSLVDNYQATHARKVG